MKVCSLYGITVRGSWVQPRGSEPVGLGRGSLAVLIGSCTTTIRNVSTAIIAVRMGYAGNVRFFLMKLPSITIHRDRRHVVSTLRIDNCGFPHGHVIVGVTPTSVQGRNSSCSLPLTVNVLTTTRRLSTSQLNRCVVVKRLSLSNDLGSMGKVLPVTVGTHRRKFGNFVIPGRGTHRTTIIGSLSICNISAVGRIVRFVTKEQSLRPAIIGAHRRFCTQRLRFRTSFSSMHKRRGIGHTLRMTTTKDRGLVLVNPPKDNGSVLTGHLPSVLPPFALRRSLRAAGVRSITNGVKLSASLVARHPFHSPRRAVSGITVINKNTFPRPKRVDLTRGKVLFLSRLPRFGQDILRIVHRPLRSQAVAISHTHLSISCPTGFVLITSVGPYPYKCCGRPSHPYLYSPNTIRGCVGHISNPLLSQVSVRMRIIPIPFRGVSSKHPSRYDRTVHRHIVGTHTVRRGHFTTRRNVCDGTRVASGLLRRCTIPSTTNLSLLGITVRHLGLSTHTCSHVLGISHAVTSLRTSPGVRTHRLTRTVRCQDLSQRA